MFAIFRRDLRSYFTSVVGYTYIAVFLFFSGQYFSTGTMLANTSDMTALFSQLLTIIMFLIPLLTMRSISEERKLKTDLVLLTSPVSLFGIVMGKFLAALTVYIIAEIMTLPYVFVVMAYGKPEIYVILGNYLGLTLLGSALIAIGLFVSAMTENQVVAAVGSFAIILSLRMIGWLAEYAQSPVIIKIVQWISIYSRYDYFQYGLLDLKTVVYYISLAAIFIFLTIRIFEKRRWS